MGYFGNLKAAILGSMPNALNEAFYGSMQRGGVAWLQDNRDMYVGEAYDNNIVYAVQRVLINKQTEAPVLVSKVVDQKSHYKYKNFISDPSTPAARVAAVQFRNKAYEDVTSGGYGTMFDLLRKPNSYQTSSEFWQNFWLFYNLTGEAFIYVIRAGEGSNRAGRPIELHVLPSQNISIVFSGDKNNPVLGYKFSIGGNTDPMIQAKDVMHLKKANPKWDTNGSQLRGYSPIRAGRKIITKNNLNIEAQAVSFKNGGSTTLIHGDPSKGKMDSTQMDRMDELIKEKIQGSQNYKNIVMTNGYLDSKKLGDSVVDQELIAADKSDVQKISSLWGVDSILIGADKNNTESNVKQAFKSLVTNNVLSDVLMRDEKLTAFLEPMYGTGEIVRTDTTAYAELTPDLELMVKIYGQPRLTENDKLELYGYGRSKDPLMDKVYMPAGLMTLEQVNANNGISNDDYI